MPKFNTTDRRSTTVAAGPLTANPSRAAATHQGGPGYRRDDKTDVFLLATTSHDITADAFYERVTPTGALHPYSRQLDRPAAVVQDVDPRIVRYRHLIREVAVTDPQWTYRFLVWLRTKGNIRTAAIVGAVEAARAMSAAGIPGGRHLINHVCQRPDEPGEVIAYHNSQYGPTTRRDDGSYPAAPLPKNIKRGVADAAARLYSERSLLKYDTASHGVRFGDVLNLTHAKPDPGKAWQRDLFTYALNRRHGHEDVVPVTLATVIANRELRATWGQAESGAVLPAPDVLARQYGNAAMTWEDVLSALGSKVDKRALWEALIPSMGYMALLRNLRNFDEAGVSDQVAQTVIARLMNADEVTRSRQLPLRFLSAYRAAPSLRWAWPLETALDQSVANIPYLTGRTLVLIDTSQSMNDRLSERSDLKRWDAAVSFGLAVARRCEAVDVVSFADAYYGDRPATRVFPTNRGESLLKSIDRWKTGGYFLNTGTDTAGALATHYKGHDRVVILTDEQTGAGQSYGNGYRLVAGHGRQYVGFGRGDLVTDQMPKDRPLYTLNLAGYDTSHAATDPNRLLLGGLTDSMFSVISRVESGRSGNWPWER